MSESLYEVDVAGDTSIRQGLQGTSRKSKAAGGGSASAREKKRKLVEQERQLAALVFEAPLSSVTADEDGDDLEDDNSEGEIDHELDYESGSDEHDGEAS